MDKSQITTIVINAVLTIVTTAVVTRLSLNRGKLGITSKLKTKLTPKFRKYIKLIFSALAFIVVAIHSYWFITNPALPTRIDVFWIIFELIGAGVWFFVAMYTIGELIAIKERERAQADPPEKK